MKNPTVIHHLALHNEKSGKIVFIHSDGKEHSFYSVVNKLSGSRLSAFDSDAPTIDQSLGEIRKIFKDIKKKAKVLSCIGDF